MENEKIRVHIRHYERKAEWAERFAVAMFASLVVQQVVEGVPLTDVSVLIGASVTVLGYYNANRLLKKAREIFYQ